MEQFFRVVSYDGSYEDVQEFKDVHKARDFYNHKIATGDYIEVTLDAITTNYLDEEEQLIIDSWSK